MNYLLFNELADGGRGKENAILAQKELNSFFPGLELTNIAKIDHLKFLGGLSKDDNVILFGGDGTLNHFVNAIGDAELPCKFYFYPSGTGNDFLNDVINCQDKNTKLVPLNDFVKGLPYIEVKGKTYRFINGIGYGIDGECCVEAEKMKANGEKDINYSKITISLLFHSYKPRNAKVKVDGKEVSISKSYLASAMNGRYYGGGMKIAPNQVRGSGKLSLVVVHGKGKLGTFMMFPGLFKGNHIKRKRNVYVATGKVIEVSFDSPCGLQIDGEVVEGVTSYKAYLK